MLPKDPRKVALYLALFSASFLSLRQGILNALERSQDTQWSSSRYFLHHTNAFDLYLHHGGWRRFPLAQNPNYPAPGVVFMWPFAAFDWPLAKALWMLSNLAFTGIILRLVLRLIPPPVTIFTKVLLGSLFVMGAGWRVTLGNGQHGLFCLGMFLLALQLHQRHRMGASVALAASWLKYTLSIPLTLFFARNREGWRVIAGAVLINAALLLFCAYWTQSSVIDVAIGPFLVAEKATDRAAGAVDVFAIAAHLGVAGRTIPGLFSLAILGVSFWAIRREASTLSALSTLALTSLVTAFHQGYDFVVLILPLAYALSVRQRSLRKTMLLIIVAFGWFVDIGLIKIAQNTPAATTILLDRFRFWFDVALFYSALGVSWFDHIRGSDPVSPEVKIDSTPLPLADAEACAATA